MTDEQTQKIGLEDVRARFLETEQRLQEAVTAIDDVRNSADTIGTTRETLVATAERLATVSGSLSDLASGLAENADQLRQGVDAIRMGDPAETRRQIEELGEAFTANQAVTSERLDAVEANLVKVGEESQSAIRKHVEQSQDATEAAISRSRVEARLGFVLITVVAGAAVVLPMLTNTA